MGINVDTVIATYLSVRQKKALLTKDYDTAKAELDNKLAKLESWMLTKAQSENVLSFKTAVGTAFLSSTDYANIADWDAFLAFVKASQSYDMLERRVSKRAVRAYIDEFKAVPAGVNFGTILGVNVRKPTKKGDKEDVD